jgi:hypothetical protein
VQPEPAISHILSVNINRRHMAGRATSDGATAIYPESGARADAAKKTLLKTLKLSGGFRTSVFAKPKPFSHTRRWSRRPFSPAPGHENGPQTHSWGQSASFPLLAQAPCPEYRSASKARHGAGCGLKAGFAPY